MFAIFLGMLDAQIVATALPRIVGDLGGLDVFAWVTTAYIIASSVTTPLYGKLSDIFGVKNVFLAAVAIFIAGSAACGLAQSIGQLIAFRTLQGIGAGGLFVSVLAIIGSLFTPREGARYYGLFGIVFAASALIGPAAGGVLTDVISWHWVFFINLPVGLVVLFLISRFLRLPSRPGRAKIDYAGFVTLAGAVVIATLLTSWGGVSYSWLSPQILGLGAGFVVLTAAFVAIERKAAEPVIPLHIFRDRTFTLCCLLSIVAGMVFLGAVNFLALYVQVVTGASPSMSGLVLLPMMLGLVVSSVGSSKLIARTGRYKLYPVLSMSLGIVAAVLLSTMDTGTPRWLAIVYMVIFGLAAGLNMQVLTMASQNTAPRADLGAVSASVTFARQLGSSVGISLFAAVFYGRLTDELAERVPPGALDATDPDSLSSQQVLDRLAAPVRHAVEQSYADSLTAVFHTAIPVLAVALVCALMLKNIPLRSQDHDTSDTRGQTSEPSGTH
ncbi:MDR family MFS transporter [Streptomyces kronopolitis]|uniref:MDR family MFS transporter n=1 Tax=Streptomyces kronopolitis TaxID=1612435 RepID=UPI00344734F5